MSEQDFQQRSRSPSYPYINLSQAVGLIETLSKKHRFSRVPIEIALKDMGYSITSGTAARIIATLSQFSLIETDGIRNDRRIWVSSLGRSILQPNPSNPHEKSEAIQDAALQPEMHKWIYDRYGLRTNPLPSEDVLRYDLIQELGFLDKKVDSFIKEFKETYHFAQLESVERYGEDEFVDTTSGVADPSTEQSTRMSQEPSDVREFSTALTRGKKARLIIPESMNSMDFRLLVMWLDMLKQADLYQEDSVDSNE